MMVCGVFDGRDVCRELGRRFLDWAVLSDALRQPEHRRRGAGDLRPREGASGQRAPTLRDAALICIPDRQEARRSRPERLRAGTVLLWPSPARPPVGVSVSTHAQV